MHVREVSVDVRLAYILHQTVELEHTFSDETMHVNIKKKISAINLYYKLALNNQVKALMVKKTLPTKKKRGSLLQVVGHQRQRKSNDRWWW